MKTKLKSSDFFVFVSVKSLSLIFFIFISGCLNAQQKVIQLYDGIAPGSENWTWNEKETNKNVMNTRLVYNVSHPTLTVFLPDPSMATGTAVIICPGGAFRTLFIDVQGFDIARELNKKGITAFVLKYRLVHCLTDNPWQEMVDKVEDTKLSGANAPIIKMAIEDAKASMIYIRQHAAEFRIDTNRIGLMGFSAGGTLTASVAYNFSVESKPDFVALMYAPIVNYVEKKSVPQDAPPMFIAAATDDHIVPVSNSVNLYNDWIDSKHSAELHLYSKSDHGLADFPANRWIDRFEEWLDVLGLLKPDR